jgi:valyl-tRNA synthetase
MQPYFASMARAEASGFGPQVSLPTTRAETKLGDIEVFVDLEGCIDLQAEIERNQKQLQRLLEQIAGKQGKLANQHFVSRAPAEVVEREQQVLRQLELEKAAVEATLSALQKV